MTKIQNITIALLLIGTIFLLVQNVKQKTQLATLESSMEKNTASLTLVGNVLQKSNIVFQNEKGEWQVHEITPAFSIPQPQQ